MNLHQLGHLIELVIWSSLRKKNCDRGVRNIDPLNIELSLEEERSNPSFGCRLDLYLPLGMKMIAALFQDDVVHALRFFEILDFFFHSMLLLFHYGLHTVQEE